MHSLNAVSYLLHHLAAAPPDPGSGTPPPWEFQNKITTVLKWAAWTVSAICVLGIFGVGGRMAIMHQRGQGGEHVAGLGWVLFAAILVGSAAALVGALV